MKISLTVLGFMMSIHPAFAQYSEEYIEAKVDSAWQFTDYGTEIEQALRIANELIEIGGTQDSYEALVNGYQLRGEYYYFVPPIEDGVPWYKKSLELAREYNDPNEEAHSLSSLGSISHFMGELELAEDYYDEALEIRESLNDTSNILFLLYKRAWLKNAADQHVKSLNDYMEGLRYAEECRDTSYMASFLMGIGIIHKKQKNYDQAEEIAKLSIEYAEAIGEDYLAAAAKGNLALVYKYTNRLPEAKAVFLEQLDYFQTNNELEGIMSCQVNLTIICNRLEQYEEALDFGHKGLKFTKQFSRYESTSDVSNEIAIAHLGLNNIDSALFYGNYAIENARLGGAVEKERDAEKLLSDAYSALGDFEPALIHYKNYTALNDSIFEREKSNTVLELQTLYETAKKEQEIDDLNNQARIDKLQNQMLFGGLIALFVFAAVVINREVKRRKKAQELHLAEIKLAESERSRLEDQLEFKNKELVSHALHLAQKNEMLQDLKSDLESIKSKAPNDEAGIQDLFNKLRFDEQIDSNWDQFTQSFSELNASFFEALTAKYPDLSKSDLRLCALLKMNLGSKDIANILNISDDGVKKARYRLRKKLNLDSNTGLESMILSFN